MIAALLIAAASLAEPRFEVSASVGSSLRRLYFRDRITPTLAGWESGALAVAGISLRAWPSTGKLPVLDDIGAYAWFQRSLSSQTLTADGTLSFSTQQTSWEAGLRWRAIVSGVERGAITIGYGNLRHDFSGARLPGYLLPDGLVQFWKPGVEGQWQAGPVILGVGAAYLAIVRQDFLQAYFPRARKAGVEASVRASMRLEKAEVTLSGRYQRFFYALHPEPYDPYVAGGALDELFALDLACGFRL